MPHSIRIHPILPLPEGATEPTQEHQIYVDLRNRLIQEATGRSNDDITLEQLLIMLPPTPDMVQNRSLIFVGDNPAGITIIRWSTEENSHILTWGIYLDKQFQNRGVGSALYQRVEECAREQKRDVLQAYSDHLPTDKPRVEALTGAGSVPQDQPTQFLQKKGYALQQSTRISSYSWRDSSVAQLQRLRSYAEQTSADYEIISWMTPTPEKYIDSYAKLISKMATDAPSGDLVMDAEERDAEWVRTHEDRSIRAGFQLQVTAARHRKSGELCAYNELVIGVDPAEITSQEDTLVAAAHRGHRLGMLVKTAGLLAWRTKFPESPSVLTYNAEENRHMLAINEEIGFVPISYEGVWEKRLS